MRAECVCLNAGSVAGNTHLFGPKLQRSHDETAQRGQREFKSESHQGQALVFQDFIIQKIPFKGFNSDSAFLKFTNNGKYSYLDSASNTSI